MSESEYSLGEEGSEVDEENSSEHRPRLRKIKSPK
jgi:hypothetical protein